MLAAHRIGYYWLTLHVQWLISYKHKKELLKEVLHIKEGQKCCCFYSKVNALHWNKRRKIICSFSALVSEAEPCEVLNHTMHHAQKAGKMIHFTSSMLLPMVNVVQRVTPTAHDACLPVIPNASVSACLDSWEKQRSWTLARVSSWSLACDCKLALQSQHMTHSTEKNISFQRYCYSLTMLWQYCRLYRREVS